tara:strand:+ start:41097 stop:41294 length:198 start_codon:yes stop_codon:yes gene_type:complete
MNGQSKRNALAPVLAIALKFPGERANVLANVVRYEMRNVRPLLARDVERLQFMGRALERLHGAHV